MADQEKKVILTREGYEKLEKELDYYISVRRNEISEQIAIARGFGDLSENFEYKAAKQEKNRNESRIRFLENMIRTAVVVSETSARDAVGLYDKVTVYLEEDDETQVLQVVTTMRQDALHGLISKESPVGKALLGHRVGDRVEVTVSPELRYCVVIRTIEKGKDDDSLAISSY